MFIYIKTDRTSKKNSLLISKTELENGYFYEINFGKAPSAASVHRAVLRCDRKKTLPIAYGGKLRPAEQKRRLKTEIFDTLLLVNAFSFVASKQKSALVIDPYGSLKELIFRPLTTVETLYIKTNRADIYEELNAQALKTFGTAAIMLDDVDTNSFPAVLSPFGLENDIERQHPFLFGKNGYMPKGNEIIVRRKTEDKLFCAARYICLKDRKYLSSLPIFLSRGEQKITTKELKVRLDTAEDNRI